MSSFGPTSSATSLVTSAVHQDFTELECNIDNMGTCCMIA